MTHICFFFASVSLLLAQFQTSCASSGVHESSLHVYITQVARDILKHVLEDPTFILQQISTDIKVFSRRPLV